VASFVGLQLSGKKIKPLHSFVIILGRVVWLRDLGSIYWRCGGLQKRDEKLKVAFDGYYLRWDVEVAAVNESTDRVG